MPIEIVTIPCLQDNYAFLIHSPETGKTALVDAPEAAAISSALEERRWSLDAIWITHHHGDHVDGVDTLRAAHRCPVVGAANDAHRLPKLDLEVGDGSIFDFEGHEVRVIDVSGHTVGHIAFHIPDAKAAFTADSLMALGCGRVFEGSFAMMWDGLCKLKELPAHTWIYSGHEYTAANAKFAMTIEPKNSDLVSRVRDVNARRAENAPTVPSLLSEELATNPFLRADSPILKAAVDMRTASDIDVFTEIRRRKDRF
ncbi:MAG: hydroxyacylglutathione hydrolase [Pseudomonadota bacterium]